MPAPQVYTTAQGEAAKPKSCCTPKHARCACCCIIVLVLAVVIGLIAFMHFGLRHGPFTSSAQSDSTVVQGLSVSRVAADGRNATILSAYFGLDDTGPVAFNLMCAGSAGTDGMPLVLSHEIDPATLDAGDFRVTDASGQTVTPLCATLLPSTDPGELRTVLLIGQLGSKTLRRACITGNLLDASRTANFKGSCIKPKSMADVPGLAFAALLPAGDSPGCPAAAPSIRLTWDAGITLEGNQRVPTTYTQAYSILLADGTSVQPTQLADVDDLDNVHVLCLPQASASDAAKRPRRVAVSAGHFEDPNADGFNLAESIDVHPPPS